MARASSAARSAAAKSLGLGRELVEGGALDRLAGLDDHHGRLGTCRDRLRQGTEQVALAVRAAGRRRCAHDHEVRLLRLPQDRVADVGRLTQDGLATAGDVELDERREGSLGLGADRKRDPGRDEVEDDDRRVVMDRDRVCEAERQFRVWSATHRDQDATDEFAAALLDDRDVARRVADDLVDRRREDGGAAAVMATGRAPAPAEDDEVRFLLGGRLDDALGRMPADAHDGVDRRAVRCVVEDPLEEASGVPGARRALGQRHPLGHLDDAERGQLAGPPVEHGGTEADQLLGRHRIGDRDEDPRGERWAVGHQPAASASFQRLTRYGFNSSNSRAWRSTRSSAWSVVTLRFSMTKLATRPK